MIPTAEEINKADGAKLITLGLIHICGWEPSEDGKTATYKPGAKSYDWFIGKHGTNEKCRAALLAKIGEQK